jgi:hypothetical protein
MYARYRSSPSNMKVNISISSVVVFMIFGSHSTQFCNNIMYFYTSTNIL